MHVVIKLECEGTKGEYMGAVNAPHVKKKMTCPISWTCFFYSVL